MLLAGTRLGPYKILSQIGAGGMGDVYRARDVRLDRDVAVKVLNDKLANDPDAIVRFEKEAKAVAALSHASILAIHDFDRDQGLFYVVTEFLEGDTLRKKVGSVSWRKAVEYGLEITKGLAAAHSRGVVHRDLKPENIFITNDGRVKILDFGLAQMKPMQNPAISQSEKGSTDTEETVLGTIGYMSPEQVRAEPADPRSDIFSLGCLLYELVSGKKPFEGETIYDTVSNVLREDPPDLAESGKKIPLELQRLILHCLEKNPEERFQSAHDVVYNLKAVMNLADTMQTSSSLLQSTLSKNRHFWFGILVVLLVVSGLLFWLSSKMSRVQSLAVIPLANMTRDPSFDYLGEGISESVTNRLSQFTSLRVMAPSTVSRFRASDDVTEIAKQLDVDAVLTGSIFKQGEHIVVRVNFVNAHDGTGLWGEQYTRKNLDFLSLQSDIAREITRALNVQLSGDQAKLFDKAPTENQEAYRAYLLGRYYWNRRTAESLQAARQHFQDAIHKDPLYSLAYTGLADCYAMLGSYDLVDPRDAYARARAAAQKALEIDSDLAEAHNSLAHVSMYYWDWQTAEQEFKRAIDLKPNYAIAHQWYSNYLSIMGRSQQAMDEARLALDLDPLSLSVAVVLGRQYHIAKQYDGAIGYYQRAIELDARHAPAYAALGQSYVQTRRYDLGIASIRKAIQLYPEATDYIALLAYAHAESGDIKEAERLLNDLRSRKGYVSPVYIALVYTGLKKYDEAFKYLQQAYDEHSEYLSFVKVEPEFEPLRSDERYARLMKSIGL